MPEFNWSVYWRNGWQLCDRMPDDVLATTEEQKAAIKAFAIKRLMSGFRRG